MKYAICNELFGDMPWEEAFTLASKYGYLGLEVAPFTLGSDVYSITSETISRFKDAAGKAGLDIIGLHWLLAKTEGYHLTTWDELVRSKTADYLAALARLCQQLGGDLMVLGSPLQRNFSTDMTHDEAVENAAWVLRRVAPELEKCGVSIAVEPLGPQEGNFLNHASQAQELILAANSPMVQLHLDVKAMSTEGVPIEQVIRENAAQMIHFHANDPNRLGPGMGDVDFIPIFRALHEIHYSGWISVEVFDYSPGVETILAQSMQNMLDANQHAIEL